LFVGVSKYKNSLFLIAVYLSQGRQNAFTQETTSIGMLFGVYQY